MRKMRLILILTVVVMLSVMVLGCDKKTTKPSATPAKMILVPGGSFTMGDATGEGFSDERPTHTVTLNSFYIGKYEVTQAEFSKYMQPTILGKPTLAVETTSPPTTSLGTPSSNTAICAAWQKSSLPATR